MTTTVYEFPSEWYAYVVTQKFTLRSLSQSAVRPWGGGQTISGPHTQVWVSDVSMASLRDPVLQDMDAFFTRLRGRAGVMRLSNAMRLAPWYDRNLTPNTATWSDGSLFTDGTGFTSGLLPPEVFVNTVATRGTNFIVMGGFPVSTVDVLRRGDLLQVKPNGVAGSVPHLYKVMFNCSSDSSGRVGVSIEPRLRADIAVGDSVGLRYASTAFRLVDDNQADIEGSGAGLGTFGFSVTEALDLVT